MARAKCRPTLEQMLVGLIVVLTLWGIVVQVMVRSYVRQERSLTSGDEDRLAEEIATIENELVQQFAPQQLDVWASESGDADERRPGVPDAADPNVPNANGEFTVSQTQLGRLARTCVDTYSNAPGPPHCIGKRSLDHILHGFAAVGAQGSRSFSCGGREKKVAGKLQMCERLRPAKPTL